MSIGAPYASGIQRSTMSDGVRNEHQTGKPLLQHELRVARAAVDDVAQHAARGERLRREFAHQCDLVVVRLADDHVARRRLGEQRAPAEQRFVACLRAVDMARYRPCRPSQLPRRVERLDRRRQHDVVAAHAAQHVVDGTRIAGLQAFGQRRHRRTVIVASTTHR
jgi:hypothetical protein